MFFRKVFSLSLFFLSFLFPSNLFGQIDSTYIQSFDQAFSARTYVVDKFSAFNYENQKDSKKDFTYKTNKPVSFGLGASWKSFSFSFSHGFNILRDRKRGNTQSLEFQHHGYGRKFVYDIFLQQHKGFYNETQHEDRSYTTYPDVKLSMYGGSFQYVLNNKKFSYKAAFNQNERQIKSAGSFLLGATVYYSKVRSDTTSLFEGMDKLHQNLQMGLSLGYAHTWVITNKWFVTGSFTAGGSMGNNYPSRFFKEKMRVYPTLDFRFAAGYNANHWSLGLSSHINRVYLFYDGKEDLSMDNVSIQLSFIWRFDWGNKFVNETLNKANKVKKKLRM